MWLQRSIAVLRRQKFQKIDFNINHDKDAAKNQPAISVLPFLSRQSQKMNTYPNAFLKATVDKCNNVKCQMYGAITVEITANDTYCRVSGEFLEHKHCQV